MDNRITVRLNREIMEEIERIVHNSPINVSVLVREALSLYLAKDESLLVEESMESINTHPI